MIPFEKCPVCGGEVVERKVEKLLRGGNNTAVLSVMADLCLHCGERYYSKETINLFEKIDFIKLDIEGAELPALKGAVEIIKKFRPVLYIEVFKEWTKEFGYHPFDLYCFLRELGYKKFILETPKGMSALDDPYDQLNQDYSADLICVF